MRLIDWELRLIGRFRFAPVLRAVIAFAIASFRSRAALQLEILALRHQIGVLQRSVKRPKLTPADRVLWAWLCCVWKGWQSGVFIMKAATVVGWHRKGFGLFWTWKIRRGKPGRPAVPKEVRELIRTLSRENPLWGAPHIHGELLKLGIHVGETSVSKYMVRRRKPPSQTWRTFLENHLKTLVSVDFFSAPQGRRSPVGEGPTQVVVGRCSWRIHKIMRRLESGTTLDSASATGTNRDLLVTQIRQQSVLAGVLPARHAFDGHYSNVENRVASSPDRPWSRIGSGRGTRAESCRSVALRRDAKAARKEQS